MLKKLSQFIMFALSNGHTLLKPSCEISQSNNIDFICGTIPAPFQPCGSNFELALGNATTATTLWFIGEFHSNKQSTNYCLDKLTEDVQEHVVYVESYEGGKEFPCQEKNLHERKGRTCIGWDNMFFKNEIEAKIPFVGFDYFPNIFQQIQNNLETMSDEEYDHFILYSTPKVQSIAQDFTLSAKTSRPMRALLRVWNYLSELRNEGYSYNEIFTKKMHVNLYKIKPEEEVLFKKLNTERNKQMMSILSKSSMNLFRIVVAGKAHLLNVTAEDSTASYYVQEELSKGQDQNNFAVLSMVKG